jgi:hypothetical protein
VINDDSISLRTPYQGNFVDQLKSRILSYARKWETTTKTWAVDIVFPQTVVDLLQCPFRSIDHRRPAATADERPFNRLDRLGGRDVR